jgi:hypothetical protein
MGPTLRFIGAPYKVLQAKLSFQQVARVIEKGEVDQQLHWTF